MSSRSSHSRELQAFAIARGNHSRDSFAMLHWWVEMLHPEHRWRRRAPNMKELVSYASHRVVCAVKGLRSNRRNELFFVFRQRMLSSAILMSSLLCVPTQPRSSEAIGGLSISAHFTGTTLSSSPLARTSLFDAPNVGQLIRLISME